MPLRDHFRPDGQETWEPLHGGWPMVIVQHLKSTLPSGFVAHPKVHFGSLFEVDVATFEKDDQLLTNGRANGSGGVAVATWAPGKPAVSIPAPAIPLSEYEIKIYDLDKGRQLVAAIELVSPSNKDRPETRKAFAAKCAALLQKGVCVVIVDVVTNRRFNLYRDLLDFLDWRQLIANDLPNTYAVSCRVTGQLRFECWPVPLQVGDRLPELPLWLGDNLAVPLPLEETYEETCATLDLE